jgi:hypothetical protein
MASAVVALTVGAAPSLAADNARVYTNERFSYSVAYPADLLRPQGESANGDGQVFKSQAGDARLTVYGQPLMKEIKTQCNAIALAQTMDGAKITHQLDKSNLSVASGLQAPGKVFYVKTVKAGKRCLFLELSYPVESRGTFDALVPKIAESLKG